MMRRLATTALLTALLTAGAGLASCDRETGSAKGEVEPASVAVEAETPAVAEPTAPEAAPLPAGEAIEGAPAFAVIYPGGVVETTPLTPVADGGAGGGVVFTSEASPDDIVEFYRRKAEAAGLASVMSMNQGETRGYGAAGAPGGAGLQVVAHPVEPGQTSVQLTWTGGQ